MTKPLPDNRRWTNQSARLKQSMVYRRVQSMIDPEQWYQVVDPEDLGFFVEAGGALRFVPWSHFELREEGAILPTQETQGDLVQGQISWLDWFTLRG